MNEYAHAIIAWPIYIFLEWWQSTWCLNALRNLIIFLLSMVSQNTTVLEWFCINKCPLCSNVESTIWHDDATITVLQEFP